MNIINMTRKCIGLFLFVGLLFGFAWRDADAASFKFTPSLQVDYNWNDNVTALDPDYYDPISMQWINYLVGLNATLNAKDTTVSLIGNIGYTQYVDASSNYKRELDRKKLSDFNYLNMDIAGLFQYRTRSVIIDIQDRLKRSNSFSDLFGADSSEFENILVYTDNVASAQATYKAKIPLNVLLRYEYQSTVFDEPENPLASTRPDSYAHKGFLKAMYGINPKLDVGVDVQGQERTYTDLYYYSRGVRYTESVADYYYIQGMAEAQYKLTSKATLVADAGAQYRHFFGQQNLARKLEDYTIPVGKISFVQTEKLKYTIDLSALYSTNTYGINAYFNYVEGRARLRYYLTKALYAEGTFVYKQDYYDREKLGYEGIWKQDRIDNVYLATAKINWDILSKRGTPYLIARATYQYQLIDSNINGPEDYLAPQSNSYGNTYYNTRVNSVMAEIIFSPTVLIGR